MKRSIFLPLSIVFFTALLLSSCSSINKEPIDEPDKALLIETVVVMPVEIVKSQDKRAESVNRQLEAGAKILSGILTDKLSDKKGIQLLTENQKESIIGDFQGNSLAVARYIGQQTGSDAVLITELTRFSERDGGEHSVNQPASVTFKCQLFHVDSGSTLCLGVFDETQQPLLSNLFSFGKASKRGFKWITGEQLAREGLDEKLNECQYLNR
ncbi:MAG: hypothetical protein HY885_16210 [Deltaproteobacteria bacterium]|nr:hypothetical protein [Deltaproteobacteria bacterium]